MSDLKERFLDMMSEEDIKELWFKITDFAREKGCNNIDLIRLLSSFLMGVMHSSKFSVEYVNMVLDRMKDSFRDMNEVEE